MIYKKGQKLTLDVVDDNPGQFIVNLDGKNVGVKKFEFQKGKESPSELSVIVDKADFTKVVLKQDMSPILAERYKTGEIHDFRVDADMTMTETPHYKVSDGMGYWIMLFPQPGIKLSKGDMVRCRIGKIKGINLNLEIVEATEGAFMKPLGISDLYAAGSKWQILRLTAFLRRRPEMAKAAEAQAQKDYEWIFQAVRGAREALFNMSLDDLTPASLEHVATFRTLVAWLLEDSTYLNDFPTGRRVSLRDELARIVSYADDLLVALKIVIAGGQQQYIEDIFSKLRTSGYLYRPESKLRTLMCIVSLNGEWMDSHMTTLIDIIHKGKEAVWKAEPFRTAFVNQLQLYIDTNHMRLDLASDIDGPEETERLDKMIISLAIQQLLRSDHTDDPDVDYTVNRSRLYRYFSFKRNVDRKKMLDKAIRVLAGATIRRDEFGWKQTEDTGLLSSQMLRVDEPEGLAYRYDTPRAVLITDGTSIDIKSPDDKAQYPALPPSLSLWSNLKVSLPEMLAPDARMPRTIQQYKRTWNAINHAVFFRQHKVRKEVEPTVSRVKHRPEIGDVVDIIVDGTDGSDLMTYHCTIVDDFYTGQGYVKIRDFNGWKRALPMWAFADDSGHPYRFRARVTGLNESTGMLTFNVYTELINYILEQVEVDDIVRGVITAQPSYKTGFKYSALTEFGYTVYVEPDTKEDIYWYNGSQVVLRITDKCNTGPRRGSIKAVFAYEDEIDEDLQSDDLPAVEYESALHLLLQNFSDEKVWIQAQRAGDPDDEAGAGGVEELLTDEAATEMMHIVARMGDVETDLTKSYNYFSFARLIAQLTGNDRMSSHYERRCQVIEILDEFASNGRVDAQELERLMPEIMSGDTLRPEIFKLRMLLALDRHEYDDMVWDMKSSVSGGILERLASLVTSYNALDGFKLVDVRRKIREQICELLHLATDIHPTQIADGREDVHTEFKTSMIYPAGAGMRRDVKAQLNEILTVIVGFMNSFGGKLYIGVSDEGYVRGVENDLAFFGSRDKMVLALNNSIHSHMTYLPGMSTYVQPRWVTYDGRDVLEIDVKRTPKAMALDSVYYERVENSTFRVRDEHVTEFLRQRASQASSIEPETVKITEHEDTSDALHDEDAPETVQIAEKRQADVAEIKTDSMRDNRLHDYEFDTDEHQPVLYLYFDEDGTFTASSSDGWLEGEKALTLALKEKESDGSLMVVYASGSVVRIPVSKFANQGSGKLSGGDKVLFIAPVSATDGLLMYYRGDDGVFVKQAFAPDTIGDGDLWSQGSKLIPKGADTVECEVLHGEKLTKFRQLQRNGQRIGRLYSDLEADVMRSRDMLS